jgi:hypothetical protein
MRPGPQNNGELKYAFPSEWHNDARIAIEPFPKNPYWWDSFTVRVDNESVSIPYRVCHNLAAIKTDKLSDLQRSLVDCIQSTDLSATST